MTGWQDAIVGAYAGMDDPGPTYLRAAREGDLSAHVVGALWWDRSRGEEQIADLVERRDALHARAVPRDQRQGHAGRRRRELHRRAGRALPRPLRPRDHQHRPLVRRPRRAAARTSRLLDAEGFQVHVHAIGDRGAREALDAFEGTDPERRHHIAHLQLVHPDDVRRFAELGVAANLQMLWACLDEQMVELTLPFLGEERATWQYPFGDLERAGARLVAGSDWPVSTPNPLEAIHVAVNRTAYGERPAGTSASCPSRRSRWSGVRGVHLRLGVDQPPRQRGRAASGRVADLVVLDRDPFAGSADDIGAPGWCRPGSTGRRLPPEVERQQVAVEVETWNSRCRSRCPRPPADAVQHAGGVHLGVQLVDAGDLDPAAGVPARKDSAPLTTGRGQVGRPATRCRRLPQVDRSSRCSTLKWPSVERVKPRRST